MMDLEQIRAHLYDVPHLLELRRALRRASRSSEPLARVVAGARPGPGGRLGILSGSFNPPTRAHTALAEAALAAGAVDAVLFALGTTTVDKEVVTGAALEDRLLVLDLIARRDRRLGVLLVNRGLYVEQAGLVRAALGSEAVVFLVGFDKIVQILDPRYYADRDAALERLFGLARFLVAPRGPDGPAELATLLDRPENRRFAPAVRPLDLPATLREVASSRVRASAAGERTEHLPPEAEVFIEETGAYDREAPGEIGGGRYRQRLALLDELEASGGRADFRAAFGPSLGGDL